MTKRERRIVQDFINSMGYWREQSDNAFKKLQDLNGTEGTGKRWCCAKTNCDDLLSVGKDYSHIYKDYVEANAKENVILRFGQELADIGFWKSLK